MKVILKGRAFGKTTDIVKQFLKDDNAILFVLSEKEKERICRDYNISTTKVCSWENHKGKTMGSRRNVYIDNVDMFIQQQFNWLVKCVSMDLEIRESPYERL